MEGRFVLGRGFTETVRYLVLRPFSQSHADNLRREISVSYDPCVAFNIFL